MSRNLRQTKILEIIANNQIETQDDLARELADLNFNVTQATISRDIKELNLIKTMTEGNRYKYVAMHAVDSKLSGKMLNLFQNTVLSVVCANNMVVLKTVQNSALAVSNIVEQLNLPEIIGVVGQTNTVLIVTANAKEANSVADKLTSMQN